MAIKFLSSQEHQEVVERLTVLARNVKRTAFHSEGPEYMSLMVCFLMHNMAAAEALLHLRNSFSDEWFPATIGYVITRSMFETEVTAHYITENPKARSKQYIEYERILNKKEMDVCLEYRKSKNPQWREAMDLMWRGRWASKETEVNKKYNETRHHFETRERGKRVPFRKWSGKTLRQMAIDVDHKEAYDVFYAELSSFTHIDVRLANRFLRISSDGMFWSQRPSEFDVGNVFRYAASFLTCFLKLFGEQFNVWTNAEVDKCWDVKNA